MTLNRCRDFIDTMLTFSDVKNDIKCITVCDLCRIVRLRSMICPLVAIFFGSSNIFSHFCTVVPTKVTVTKYFVNNC